MNVFPLLCDFEQWIDTEIKQEDKELMEKLKQWDAEHKERVERRCKEEAAKKECEAERQMRREVEAREVRKKKLERARRAETAMEENPDALRKGKWPRCTL